MIEIGRLTEGDIGTIVTVGGDRERRKASFWHGRLAEQVRGALVVVVARDSVNVVGHVLLKWHSRYRPFAKAGIPEIIDLRVAPRMRRRGIAKALIARCEQLAGEKGHKSVGLGVGLTADYGPAQRLYPRLGFKADGAGVTHKGVRVRPGQYVRVDDELILWLTKDLSEAAAAVSPARSLPAGAPLDVARPQA